MENIRTVKVINQGDTWKPLNYFHTNSEIIKLRHFGSTSFRDIQLLLPTKLPEAPKAEVTNSRIPGKRDLLHA
jgi:hypothetical protein